MNNKEFSNEFDVLLNSFGLTPNIVLDEYEKSVYLTKALEDIIRLIYSGNNTNYSFELTEEIRRYLSNLVETYSTKTSIENKGLSKYSKFYLIPSNVWFITYEQVILNDPKLGCSNNIEASVIPILLDEYYRIKDNPFRGSTKNRVLRLDVKDSLVELISTYNIEEYLLRFLGKPTPIILIDLPEDLSINGENTYKECALAPVLHRLILEKAVQIALISKTLLLGTKEKE